MKVGTRSLSLDIVRGIAILLVIFTHNPVSVPETSFLFPIISFLNRIGWAGVDLFFVLSGFLVGGLLMHELKNNHNLRIKRFIVRRAFKVWPTYYIFLLSYTLFQIARPQPARQPASLLLRDFWPNFLHIQNYFQSTSELGWLWSLGVEEHFYLLIPFLLAFLFLVTPNEISKDINANEEKTAFRVLKTFGIFLVGIIVLRAISFHWTDLSSESRYSLYTSSHLRVDSLFAGVLLAYFVHFHFELVEKLRRWRFVILTLSVASLALPYLAKDPPLFLYPFGFTILYLAFAGVVLFSHFESSNKSEIEKERLSLKYVVALTFAFIGVRSYSIYVWHGYWAKPIAHRLMDKLAFIPLAYQPYLSQFIYLIVPIALGSVMFWAIEEPFLKLRARLYP